MPLVPLCKLQIIALPYLTAHCTDKYIKVCKEFGYYGHHIKLLKKQRGPIEPEVRGRERTLRGKVQYADILVLDFVTNWKNFSTGALTGL